MASTNLYAASEGLESDKKRKLFGLIESRQWDAVIAFVEEHPSQAFRGLESFYGSDHSNLPLHEACKNQPSLAVVEAFLKAHPDAIKAKGQWGNLPLHYACCSGASKDVVQRLIRAYPNGTRLVDDNNEALPLHLAAKWGASDDVLLEVLTAYPEAMDKRDKAGKTPMDYANASTNQKEEKIRALEHGPKLAAASQAARDLLEHETSTKVQALKDEQALHIVKLETWYKEKLDKEKATNESLMLEQEKQRLEKKKMDDELLGKKDVVSQLMKKMKTDAAESVKKVESYKAKLDESRKENARLVSKDKENVALVTKMQIDAEQASSVIETYKEQLEERREENNQLMSQTEATEKLVKQMGMKAIELQSKIENHARESSKSIQEYKENLDDTRERLMSVSDELAQTKKAKENLENVIAVKEQEQVDLKKSQEETETKYSQVSAALEHLTSELSEEKDEKNRLTQEVLSKGEEISKVAGLKKELKEAEGRIEHFKQKLDEACEVCVDVNVELSEVKQAYENLETKLDERDEEIIQLKENIYQQDGEITTLVEHMGRALDYYPKDTFETRREEIDALFVHSNQKIMELKSFVPLYEKSDKERNELLELLEAERSQSSRGLKEYCALAEGANEELKQEKEVTAALTDSLRENEGKNSQLEEILKDMKEQIAAQTVEFDSYKCETMLKISDLQETARVQEVAVNDMESKLKIAEIEQQSLVSKSARLEKMRKEAAQDLLKTLSELNSVQIEARDWQKKYIGTTKTIETYELRMMSLKKLMSSLSSSMNSWSVDNDWQQRHSGQDEELSNMVKVFSSGGYDIPSNNNDNETNNKGYDTAATEELLASSNEEDYGCADDHPEPTSSGEDEVFTQGREVSVREVV